MSNTVQSIPSGYRSFYYSEKLFSGVVHPSPLPIGCAISIGDVKYTVKSSKMLEFRLYHKVGKITLFTNSRRVSDQKRVLDFLKSIGFESIRAFCDSFMRTPVLVGEYVAVNLFYLSFVENPYL